MNREESEDVATSGQAIRGSKRLKRRALLSTQNNPDPDRDYLVHLELTFELSRSDLPSVRLQLHYVPDRLVLLPDSLNNYFKALAGTNWETMESLGAELITDLANELVPRWIQVELTHMRQGVGEHRVVLDDRQPGWDNPIFLGRLSTL